MAEGPNWAIARAPTLDEFETLARTAYRALPDQFRQWTTDIMIRIEEFASDEVLDSLGIESEYDLMGLYQGVSLDRKTVMDCCTAVRSSTTGRLPMSNSAISSLTYSCTRSDTTSAYPTTTWKTLKPKRVSAADHPNDCGIGASRRNGPGKSLPCHIEKPALAGQ